jgi:biotin carboxyl carrier protein
MADAVIGQVWRHKETDVLVQPPIDRSVCWTPEQNSWLDEGFIEVPPTNDTLTNALRSIAERMIALDAGFIVFNVSTFVPNEKVYWFKLGDPETTAIRAGRVNLVVERLVAELDITLVDVDRIVAELGAREAVIGPTRYTSETLDIVSEEAAEAILNLANVSREFASNAMSLAVPRYDRRTIEGTLTRWHVAVGSSVIKGDKLFDLRFDHLQSRLASGRNASNRSISLSVLAGRTGVIDRITSQEGEQVSVGTMVGVIVAAQGIDWSAEDVLTRFPIGVTLDRRDDEK